MIENNTGLLIVNALVGSEAPQGSVMGPIHSVIFIEDIEVGICGNVLKFAAHSFL